MSMQNVEDVYPLSPMQEVMLLHTLANAKADALFNQFCYELRGDLNPEALRQAWQQIVDRHPILRTAFVWENLKQPLQVVRQRVALPFEQLDWRGLSTQEQHTRLEAFRQADRQQGFSPAQAPLMRLALIQCASDAYYLVWSSHHLLLDRWCIAILFDELCALYTSNGHGQPAAMESPRPFRDYIAWIQQQNPVHAEVFWRQTLQGLPALTPITADGKLSGDSTDDEPTSYDVAFSTATTTALRTFARRHGLTVSTVFQGVWALLLNYYTGRQDVVFGATVSGRPPQLPGVDTIVGSFINNVPVRIRLSDDTSLIDWFKDIQNAQQKRSPFEHVSLASMHEWGTLPPSQHLFDHLLVWLAPTEGQQPEGFTLHGLPGNLTTAYPLTLAVMENPEHISVQAYRDPRRRTIAPMPQMLKQLETTLDSVLAVDPHCRLAALPGFQPDPTYRSATESREVTSDTIPGNGKPRASEYGAAPEPGGREDDLAVEVYQNMLLAEWQRVLGTHQLALDDDFFDLGGDSLLAVQLHARVEATTGQVIPLLSLFQAPTVRQMATTLCKKDWPLQPHTLRPIQPRGTKPPLFCVASPEVNTIGYTLLARNLDPEQPVYVLQAPPDTQAVRRLEPSELPELAAQYIEAMQTVQTTGPFHLLGMCTGAFLALEMATQLEVSQQPVAFVGVLNTWALYTISKLYYLVRVIGRVQWYMGRLRSLLQLQPREQLATLRQVLQSRLTAVKQKFTGMSEDREEQSMPPDRPGKAWIEDIGWAQQDVSISKYRGCVTVFRIRKHNQQYWRVRDPQLGWANHAETVDVVLLPGKDHDAILLEPDVKALAKDLQERLETSTRSHTLCQ